MSELLQHVDVQAELPGWRVLLDRVHATFRTGSFAKGAEFIARITELAEDANHHPDVDLRYPAVHISLISHDVGGLTMRDINLARQISQLAEELGIQPDLHRPQATEIAIDALDISSVKPFWQAVFGYQDKGEGDLVDPLGIGPAIWFQQMDEPRPQRNRIHIDVTVPHDVAEERMAAAIDAGGHLVSDDAAPAFWVLADAEGNEACICTWQGRA
ncbi:4a-hydroxytetrahydrobiopterin dehydratase [Actinobacteria bacterium YIM 96077]|uniref:Putative pterin-4-alpha-carbinolamine dehydratase n=1 Tax=Phytoactinopolyspora halophila TaxID=1981511 RepID=A0A329R3W4_9ACTN|nr:4a-hydroxytetrahydrobiopterin dehydratase [Phytoactinopolyspora halophila]AYY15437.1 4a-hydroxytetrahydrobiopterin dehydratase [Actinobacteria bacterium YIM 96077]RAW17708.1 4a-hydroxytetrahydrobiopterin dehydratase [Phytoactinopolyspora halophila]